MAAHETDLTTATKVAGILGVSTSDRLQDLVTAASGALRNHLGYPLHRRTGVVEGVAGGGQRLLLRAGAVQSITSITEYGTERAADTYVLEDGVKGVVLSRSCAWRFTGRRGGVAEAPLHREDTGQILVTFTAGWVTPGQVSLNGALTRDLPHEIEQACVVLVTSWYRGDGQDARLASVSLGDASMSFSGGARVAIPSEARALVARYKKHVR